MCAGINSINLSPAIIYDTYRILNNMNSVIYILLERGSVRERASAQGGGGTPGRAGRKGEKLGRKREARIPSSQHPHDIIIYDNISVALVPPSPPGERGTQARDIFQMNEAIAETYSGECVRYVGGSGSPCPCSPCLYPVSPLSRHLIQ